MSINLERKINQLKSEGYLIGQTNLAFNDDGMYVECEDAIRLSVKKRGTENIIYRAEGNKCNNTSISIIGHNNVVILSGYSDFSNSILRISGNNNFFYFGAFSTVGSMTTLLSGNDNEIIVGDFCMFSNRLFFDTSDSHSIYDLDTSLRINHDKGIKIGNHVWIGRDVRVSKGSIISSNCIIGQGSLVSGELNANCIYGGVPARLIRENVTWSRMKSDSIEEMESTNRHKEFAKRVQTYKEKLK